MKKSFLLSLFALCLVVLSSCKDKLDLVGDKKESAVVIGLLDKNESTHYVKITRTFIGDGVTSAVDIAAIADSSYFNQVEAVVTEVLPGGSQGRVFNLYDTIIENKNTNGVFYAPNQKVYVFHTPTNAPLRTDATYKLKVTIDGGRIVVTGETKLVDGITPGNWSQPNVPITLTNNSTVLGEYVNQVITYESVGTSYKIAGKVDFEYTEYGPGMMDSVDRVITFSIGEGDVANINAKHSFSFSGSGFYQTLRDVIPVTNTVEKRVFKGFRITATGASRELASYMNINKPATSLAQNKPTYTNLTITEGHSVIGLFSSRLSHTVYKQAVAASSFTQGLNKKSRRELCQGPLTGNLSFCSNHSLDQVETWSCN